MANQEQNPLQQEQPSLAAKKVSFNLEDILLNTNNEVPKMYKEYLAEFWYSAKALEHFKVSFSIPTGGIYGEVGVNTFRNAIGAHYLPHSSEYVTPPSIDIVRPWFETIRYAEKVSTKGTLKKSLLPPREKVVPYTRFLSLLMMHKMKEGYGDGDVTLYPTQVFSVNNWAMKPNQPEEPPFTDHMLAICSAAKPVVFKAPKPSLNTERIPQGTKPEAQPGHKKHSTSSKQPSVFSREATKGVMSKARANPQLSSGMSTFNLNEPIYSASFIIHSESASGNDASAVSTAEADLGKFAPSDFIPQQQGLETVLTQPTIGKGDNSIARQVEEDEALRTIKLEDLAKLVSSVQLRFKDLDSPKDDPIIVVDDSDEDEEANEVHATTNTETEDALAPKSSSPMSSQIQELTNQVLILQSQKHKLELKKNKAEAALLRA
ncbi:hypothetical protein Tco_0626837 [Tanacetum coccineum]|uniref:Aminotransferase-like plant mobile domain-containing protein n=1 Tax=Tanacetum coccineum TaxID=301880 RepID=A0ABQ4WKR7_9ASTR